MIVEIEDSEEEEEEEPRQSYYYVQVFPSDTWEAFPMEVNSDETTIVRTALLAYVEKILSGVSSDESIVFPLDTLEYQARIVRNCVFNDITRTRVCLSDMTDLRSYPSYINTDTVSTKLNALLNDRSGTQTSLRVKTRSFADSTIIIMVAPRSIAHTLYKIPALPPTLTYKVTIFDGSPKELGRLIEYDNLMTILNANLKEPLPLIAPTDPRSFTNPDNIVFVAKMKNRIIGYCTCALLRYREEISSLMDKEINNLLDQHPNSLSRYLMNKNPHHIYEIEGLSADPTFARTYIGYTLLYQALHFIRDPLMHKLYPVTHIASQAASYITKRFLTGYFGFHYHGSNLFKNEHFVETIGEASKLDFMKGIREQLAFYEKLFKNGGTKTMKGWLDSNSQNATLVKGMFFNVVQLYQIFFVLVKTITRPGAACGPLYECAINETLAQLVTLFRDITTLLPPRDTLSIYFNNNIARIKTHGVDVEETIYTRAVATTSEVVFTMGPVYKEYGFLYKEKEKTKKIVLREGYDLIYKSLPNMINLSKALKVPPRPVELVLNNINALVLTDLKRDVDYEIPQPQLKRIRDAVNLIIKTRALSPEKDEELKTLVKLTTNRDVFIRNNELFNLLFTTFIYEISDKVSSGFDTYTSFDELDEQWATTIAPRYEQRTNPNKLIPNAITVRRTSNGDEEEEGEEEIEGDMDVVVNVFDQEGDDIICEKEPSIICSQNQSSPPLELLPESTDINRDINELYEILVQIQREDAVFTFRGHQYTTKQLVDHLNRLMHMQRESPIVINIPQGDGEGDDIEVEGDDGEMQPYRLGDFIDDNLLGEEEYEGIL